MAKNIRVRCPICGSMPSEKQLLEPKKPYTYKVQLYHHEFGGKLPIDPNAPYKKYGIGQAPGIQIYSEDFSAEDTELFEKWTKWFAEQVVEFGKANGLIE